MYYSLLTISDGVASSVRKDLSGDKIAEIMKNNGWQLLERRVVFDETDQIKSELTKMCAGEGGLKPLLILTTGGTGLAPRDNTPEASLAVFDYEVPGITEAIRAKTLDITPYAMLSRAVSGVKDKVLIVNLPGSTKAVSESMEVVFPVFEHAVQLIVGKETWQHRAPKKITKSNCD